MVVVVVVLVAVAAAAAAAACIFQGGTFLESDTLASNQGGWWPGALCHKSPP